MVARRVPLLFGDVAMVVKRTSRARASPNEWRRASSSGRNGRVEVITRSAPSNVRAWSSIARARLWRNEPMLTRAAIPRVIEMEKSNNRRRLDRLSRHAIFQMKEEIIDVTRLLARHQCGRDLCVPTLV